MANSNIINAVFGSGLCAVTTSAFRANYGMVLRFSGIDLPTAFEVDFSNYDVMGRDSITMIGQNGEVQIPDDLWDSGLNIYAYVYLHPTDDSGVTVYTVTIPVLGRPNRTEEEPTPHEQTLIEQAISALNDAVEATAADVETTTANAQAAAQSEANAATSERSAAASAGAALASQNAAHASETASAQSAQSASGSADQASQSAQASAESADTAQGAAASAERSEQNASASAASAQSKANEAASSAATATDKATESAQSASSASVSAQNAASAATAAESSATDAEQAKTDAQDAKDAAEQAMDDAVSAADRAEQAEQEVLSAMDGTYENLTSGNAQQLLSTVTESDSVPYLFRQTAKNADREYLDAVVGGTVAWNQLLQASDIRKSRNIQGVQFTNNADGSVTLSGTATDSTSNAGMWKNKTQMSGHVYLSVSLTSKVTKYDNGGYAEYGRFAIVSGTEYNVTIWPQLFDLTAMFGSTIADYIYNLETASTGAGVAYFRKLFPNDYYEYNSGELLSVGGVSAHTMRDADGNVISTYPLDSSLTLRGIPKLDNGNLYYDGDTYAADGTVTRRYGVVDLGTRDWTSGSGGIQWYTALSDAKTSNGVSAICPKYINHGFLAAGWASLGIGEYAIYYNTLRVYPSESYSDYAAFKAAMSGVYLVYELATPTTETAEPYRHLQICDPNGTEEFVSTSIVPVGHNTRYPENLRAKIEGLPWNFNSIIAMTETTTTASKAYSVGDYFILNNVLYRVTSAIASGGTITIGTNCRATTIMDEIKALS